MAHSSRHGQRSEPGNLSVGDDAWFSLAPLVTRYDLADVVVEPAPIVHCPLERSGQDSHDSIALNPSGRDIHEFIEVGADEVVGDAVAKLTLQKFDMTRVVLLCPGAVVGQDVLAVAVQNVVDGSRANVVGCWHAEMMPMPRNACQK